MATGYAEVIYETGAKSVVSYDDLEALKSALREQNERALTGVPGGPAGHAAERIKRVLLYDAHPGDYMDSAMLSVDDAKAVINSVNTGGQVSVWELINGLRGAVGPLADKTVSGPHDSMYLAAEKSELGVGFLDEGAKA